MIHITLSIPSDQFYFRYEVVRWLIKQKLDLFKTLPLGLWDKYAESDGCHHGEPIQEVRTTGGGAEVYGCCESHSKIYHLVCQLFNSANFGSQA